MRFSQPRGNGLVLLVVSGIGFTFLITVSTFVIGNHAPYFTIFTVALFDLVFMEITGFAACGFAADGNMKQTA